MYLFVMEEGWKEGRRDPNPESAGSLPGQGQAEARGRNSFQFSHVRGGSPSRWVVFCFPPRHFSSDLGQR